MWRWLFFLNFVSGFHFPREVELHLFRAPFCSVFLAEIWQNQIKYLKFSIIFWDIIMQHATLVPALKFLENGQDNLPELYVLVKMNLRIEKQIKEEQVTIQVICIVLKEILVLLSLLIWFYIPRSIQLVFLTSWALVSNGNIKKLHNVNWRK